MAKVTRNDDPRFILCKVQWGELDWVVRFEEKGEVRWIPVHRGDWFDTAEAAGRACNDTVTAAHRG